MQSIQARLMGTGVTLAALALGFATVGRAAVFAVPQDGALIGHDTVVQSKASDTLLGIARQYSIGYWEIQAANPHVKMWLPGQGTSVVIPGRFILPPVPHKGIVVNLPAHRLFYFPRAGRHDQPIVITYPVSPGEKGPWATPVGVTRVIRKVPHPVWVPTKAILKAHAEEGDPIPKVWPAGPNNPMGEWALETTLSRGEVYIHGTNNPLAIGMSVTHGCIRLYPEDIAALYPIVRVGTPVTIVNDPILATLQDGKLYLAIHPPTNSGNVPAKPDYARISQVIDQAIGNAVVAIDWDRVRQMAVHADGVPEIIGVEADASPGSSLPGAQGQQVTSEQGRSARPGRAGA